MSDLQATLDGIYASAPELDYAVCAKCGRVFRGEEASFKNIAAHQRGPECPS